MQCLTYLRNSLLIENLEEIEEMPEETIKLASFECEFICSFELAELLEKTQEPNSTEHYYHDIEDL